MNTDEKLQKIGEQVIEVICGIYDPEIPVNIYDLGLIYDVKVSEKNGYGNNDDTNISNCPVAESLPLEIEEKVNKLNEVQKTKVEVVFEPPWSKEMMSEGQSLNLECYEL